MANWIVTGREVTFHDALHNTRNGAVVYVTAGPIVDAGTERTYFYAVAGQTKTIIDHGDRVDSDAAYGPWCARIRLGRTDISGRIYLFAQSRTKLLRKLKQYVYVVEHGLENSNLKEGGD